jgi:hypothetical protein
MPHFPSRYRRVLGLASDAAVSLSAWSPGLSRLLFPMESQQLRFGFVPFAEIWNGRLMMDFVIG